MCDLIRSDPIRYDQIRSDTVRYDLTRSDQTEYSQKQRAPTLLTYPLTYLLTNLFTYLLTDKGTSSELQYQRHNLLWLKEEVGVG